MQQYSAVRIEGLISKSQLPGTVPLSLYYSSTNQDYASTTASTFNATYDYIGLQGYVYTSQAVGMVPIDLYWSAQRKDYYLVGSPESLADAKQNGYVLAGRQGYAYPGPDYANTCVEVYCP
eukprot:TRINITY_DN830_c0_g1_i1.p1 TRINITY_DN830_c0_g1~~TRINITY_DN830_c0_g1_i1.p1  ORF type:complete len:121 (+),score=15.21 TRINITY_DN830_c0_g1_i1:183-545(+)